MARPGLPAGPFATTPPGRGSRPRRSWSAALSTPPSPARPTADHGAAGDRGISKAEAERIRRMIERAERRTP